MTQDIFCPICKIQFHQALWCPNFDCPITDQREPTAQQRETLKMDDETRGPYR